MSAVKGYLERVGLAVTDGPQVGVGVREAMRVLVGRGVSVAPLGVGEPTMTGVLVGRGVGVNVGGSVGVGPVGEAVMVGIWATRTGVGTAMPGMGGRIKSKR
jgi:hypothetical protein